MITRKALGDAIVPTVLLGPFLLVSGWLVTWPITAGLGAAWTYAWPATPCAIVGSWVRGEGDKFRFLVRYQYRAGGTSRFGDRFRIGYAPSESRGTAEELTATYYSGRELTCYVNPLDAQQAVLVRGDAGLMASDNWIAGLVGLAFFVPLSFAWAMMCSPELVRQIRRTAESEPRAFAKGVLLVLAAVFISVALALGWVMIAQPTVLLIHAQSWTPTNCVIVRSQLTSHPYSTEQVDSSGHRSVTTRTAYGHDLLYRYEVGGRQYVGRRDRFFESSAGQATNQAIVDRFREGATVPCFVDPRQPEQVVLDRGVGLEVAWGLVPLLTLAIGMGLLWVRRRLPENVRPR